MTQNRDALAGAAGGTQSEEELQLEKAQEIQSPFSFTSDEKDFTLEVTSTEVENSSDIDPKGWSAPVLAGYLDTVPEAESDLA